MKLLNSDMDFANYGKLRNEGYNPEDALRTVIAVRKIKKYTTVYRKGRKMFK